MNDYAEWTTQIQRLVPEIQQCLRDRDWHRADVLLALLNYATARLHGFIGAKLKEGLNVEA
jgi:hypothetical protein